MEQGAGLVRGQAPFRKVFRVILPLITQQLSLHVNDDAAKTNYLN